MSDDTETLEPRFAWLCSRQMGGAPVSLYSRVSDAKDTPWFDIHAACQALLGDGRAHLGLRLARVHEDRGATVTVAIEGKLVTLGHLLVLMDVQEKLAPGEHAKVVELYRPYLSRA